MNKKILSIFVMVMALSLLGVSCNKKTTDPTNGGGGNTTTQNQDFGTLTPDNGAALGTPVTISGIGATVGASKTANISISINPNVEGVQYAVTAVTREVNSSDTQNQVDTGLDGNKDAFTYDGTTLTLVQNTEIKNNASNKTDYYKVTITVSKEGYNSKTVDVYVKLGLID